MDPLAVLITAALLLTFGYIASCAVYPFKTCRSCHGTGHHTSPLTRAYRPCHRCGTTGMRLRIGRRAYTTATRINRNRRNTKGGGGVR